MTSEEIAVWGRVMERLLIILSAGSSLWLGYWLFKIGAVEPQTADIKVQSVTIRLQKVAPGIFFAMFATAVFIWSLGSPLSINAPATVDSRMTQLKLTTSNT